jgi:hypothetical protein
MTYDCVAIGIVDAIYLLVGKLTNERLCLISCRMHSNSLLIHSGSPTGIISAQYVWPLDGHLACNVCGRHH